LARRFLVSLWILIVLGLSAGAEIPLILPKLQSLSTSSPEEIMKMWQDLNTPKVADAMLIGSMAISSLVRALLRPILGIAFVLLYLDTRADFSESELAPPTVSSSISRAISTGEASFCGESAGRRKLTPVALAKPDEAGQPRSSQKDATKRY